MTRQFLVVYAVDNVMYIRKVSNAFEAIDTAVRSGDAVIYENGEQVCSVASCVNA